MILNFTFCCQDTGGKRENPGTTLSTVENLIADKLTPTAGTLKGHSLI